MITVPKFYQWTLELSNGATYECDTLDEVLAVVVHNVEPGQKATIGQRDRKAWLKATEMAREFNAKRLQQDGALQELDANARDKTLCRFGEVK